MTDSTTEQVDELLGRMTVAEKAGMMFQGMMPVGADGELVEDDPRFGSTRDLVLDRLMNHFNVLNVPEPAALARWHNRIQALARDTRLGIPITISSDPRHSFSENIGADFVAEGFSKWPQPIGFAAIGDAEIVREFADIARQEYLATGIRVALHPMADLATEPRWSRLYGTFGEDAELAASLVAAYIKGFQGEDLRVGVACMTKHFPGGGPQKDGEDPHFAIGKEQVYPGGMFDHHLIPFRAAFEAGTAQIMPYYGMPLGTEHEEVGFGFNRSVISGLLRDRFGFDGVVCTDWRLLTPVIANGVELIDAKCWGVEHLDLPARILKALDAGVDQFGGEICADEIVRLVEAGRLPESRLDQSVQRLLRDKFRLGLFDDPFVDEQRARQFVGNAPFLAAGERAQRRAIVLLTNRDALPLPRGCKVYLEGVSTEAAGRFAEVVETPDAADFAIIRLQAPYEPREGLLESRFHSGDLDFKGAEKQRILDLLDTVPSIVDIYLERPAVIPEIAKSSVALLGNFGAADEALLDVVFGDHAPEGRLPFELPSSMAAVRKQKPDVPADSENPLFAIGHGLTYRSD